MQSLLGKKILSSTLLFFFSILGAKSSSAQVTPVITSQPASQTVTAGQPVTFTVVIANGPCRSSWSINGTGHYGSFASTISYTIANTTLAMNGWKVSVDLYDCGSTGANLGQSQTAILTVMPAVGAPAITAQPANLTVTAGQTATFSVAATGAAPLSYQWQKNGANIGGATSSSYTSPATTVADTGALFVAVVSNAAGNATSNPAKLTVNTPIVAPMITAQPANLTVTAGQTATFGVAATGTAPLSYQWQKNGANIGGATSSSYTSPATTVADTGALFVAVVSNAAGNATSNPAKLTVNASTIAPTITAQPSNQTVTVGQTATLAVAAGGTAPLSYQWHKNGAMIGGATSASYTTPAATSADNGSTFQVSVGNSVGSVMSNAATMTVNQTGAPSIAQQPQSQTVQTGQSATFTVVIANGPCRSNWFINGAGHYGSFASTISYTIPSVTLAMNGWKVYVNLYGCGTNGTNLGNSQTAILTVNSTPVAPTITTQPANQTVATGQTATFTVGASGTTLNYQWQKNGAPISGATGTFYTTPATAPSDNNATFQVVVSNSAGTASSNTATLMVTTDTTPPTVSITAPSSGTTASGTIAVTASASDDTAVSNVQFQVDGTNVGAADTTSPYSFSLDTTTLSNGAHSLTAVAVDTSGNHATSMAVPITVSNQAGSAVPTYANNGAGCPINDDPSQTATDSVYTYTCPLPNPTGAGNLLVVMVRYELNTNPTVSFTDEVSNQYLQAAECSDSHTGTGLYYVQNTKAGARSIVANFSSWSGRVSMGVYEFYNVAATALDHAACGSGTSATSLTPGSLSVSSGDLVFQFGMVDDTVMINGCTPSGEAGINWTQRTSMILDYAPQCAQYGIYTGTTGSLSPSFTVNTPVSYVSAAAAFMPATAGTAPPSSGIRVAYIQHDDSVVQNTTSVLTQMPISGNLAVVMYTGSSDYVTAISDSTNTWKTVGPTHTCNSRYSPPGDCSAVWYSTIANPGTYKLNFTKTTMGSVGFGDAFITYDIVGASSNPVDTGFGVNGLASATGCQGPANCSGSGSGGPVTGYTAAPSGPNELILTSIGQGFDTITGLTSPSCGLFTASHYTNETNSSHDDLNGGWGLCYNGPSTAPQTWIFTHDSSQVGGVDTWTILGAAFVPATP